MIYLTTRISTAIADIERGLRDLERLREAQEAVEEQIKADRTILGEEKRLLIEEARRRAGTKVEQVLQTIRSAKDDASKAIDDGWRARPISAEARAQVRRLIDAGQSPGDILSTARRIGDAEAVQALRSELPWVKAGSVPLDTPALLEAVDETMAEIAGPPEQDIAKGARRLRALSEVADKSVKLSLREAAGSPSPSDRVSLGYAQNDAKETA